MLEITLQISSTPHTVPFDPSLPLSPQSSSILRSHPNLLTSDAGPCSSSEDKGACLISIFNSAMTGAIYSHIDQLYQQVNRNLPIFQAVPVVYDAISELQQIMQNPDFKEGDLRVQILNNLGYMYNHLSLISDEAVLVVLSEAATCVEDEDINRGIKVMEDQEKSTFRHIEQTYAGMLDDLTAYATSFDEEVEGGMWMRHTGAATASNHKESRKRECVIAELYATIESGGSRIAEIGFNAGQSSAIYLSLFPSIHVTAFDICQHEYTRGAAEALSQKYGRLELVCGDSLQTLPGYWAGNDGSGKDNFDFVMVDGNHEYEWALGDIKNACRAMGKGGKVMVDDCDHQMVRLAWMQAVKEGTVMEWHKGVCWIDLCTGICE